jgi:hypothetical protein
MKEDDVKPDIMVKIIVITGSMAVLKPMVSPTKLEF